MHNLEGTKDVDWHTSRKLARGDVGLSQLGPNDQLSRIMARHLVRHRDIGQNVAEIWPYGVELDSRSD